MDSKISLYEMRFFKNRPISLQLHKSCSSTLNRLSKTVDFSFWFIPHFLKGFPYISVMAEASNFIFVFSVGLSSATVKIFKGIGRRNYGLYRRRAPELCTNLFSYTHASVILIKLLTYSFTYFVPICKFCNYLS